MRIPSWLRIGVSATAVIVIVWRVPTSELWSAFGTLHGASLWPALGCVLATLAVRFLKWRRLLRSAGLTFSSRDAARPLFGGFALVAVGPGRLGELGRCLFVAKTDRALILLLTVLDRALDFWGLLTMTVFSLLVVVPRPIGVFSMGIWLACVPILVGLPRLVAGMGSLPWWREGFRTELRNAGRALLTVSPIGFAGLSLCSSALDLGTFFFVLRSLHSVDPKVALATFPWIVMAGGLPISMSGLGAREGVAGLLLARFAVPAATAMDASLLYFAFAALLPAMLGLVALMGQRYRLQPQQSSGLATLARP